MVFLTEALLVRPDGRGAGPRSPTEKQVS